MSSIRMVATEKKLPLQIKVDQEKCKQWRICGIYEATNAGKHDLISLLRSTNASTVYCLTY
jgi:hypothetical protein